MNAGAKLATVCVVGTMLIAGCGQGPSTGNTTTKSESIPQEFKSSLLQFLELAGELNASTEAGVTRRDFSAGYAKVKSKSEILFAQWPAAFQPQAKDEIEKAMHGYELAIELWGEDSFVWESSDLGKRLAEYGVVLEKPLTGYLAANHVGKIFGVAGGHYTVAKTSILGTLSR